MGKKNWKKKTLNFAYVKFKFQFGINTCRPRLLSSGESLSYFLLFFFFFNEAPSLRIKKIMSLVYGLRKHYFFDILFRQNGRGPYDSVFLGLGGWKFSFQSCLYKTECSFLLQHRKYGYQIIGAFGPASILTRTNTIQEHVLPLETKC